MRILIDLQHPADLHFFRNAVRGLREKGHEVKLTGRDKDILVDLAEEYDLEVEVFGVARSGAVNLTRELFYRWWRLWKIVREWQPDRMLAVAGTYISLVGWLPGIETHVFYDTEHATLSNLLAYPFATCLHVPRCYKNPIRWRHERYDGYQELAYLHPDCFEPDPEIREELGVAPDESYVLGRFVGWGAAHDMGKTRLSNDQKCRLVQKISDEARVFLSVEGELPVDLEPYRLRTPLSKIHDVIAHASMVFGESGTMSSEAAVLGVPAVYINPLELGYLHEQETRYGLVRCFHPDDFKSAEHACMDTLEKAEQGCYQSNHQDLLTGSTNVSNMIERIAIKGTAGTKDSDVDGV